ncbi:hypothetical protein QE422_003065 [Chryseobacterium sp. SORGH_AS 447]|uniref:hypothetical protein n=1 Tax=Chryseobacterium sp. SORGH_AS_0447 TaxID=3041769 RepID=UPI002788D03C|nr:hypothetical protein [Chryseobacterium sp. SORGH_AS_0447]MDQ1162697.1 hypothetical protein [Chryseobacterium sp. SORGH_AS_0447]
MKKLFYSFLLLSSATLFAQKNTSTRFAVANDIVGTVDMFSTNLKGYVQSSRTFKSAAELPQNLKKFNAIAANGLVEYKLKAGLGTLDRLALSDLNAQYNLAKNTPVLIDGYEFANTDTLVYGDLLSNVQVVDNKGSKAVSVMTKK